MYGHATSNPKLNEWSKTEAVQLPVSMASVFLIILVMNSFCAIDINSVRGIFGKPPIVLATPGATTNIYYAAESYLVQSASFSRDAMIIARYHHSVYNILLMRSTYRCDAWCWFGNSGTTFQGFAGYSGRLNLMGLLFNTALTSYLSALNSLLIFLFVKRGFILLLLPMGVFLRSMPFLRTFGSVLIALSMSFFLIYPATLAVFSMMDGVFDDPFPKDVQSPLPGSPSYNVKDYFLNEANIYGRDSETPDLSSDAELDDSALMGTYFPLSGEYLFETVEFVAYAFIAAVFLPTVALLATVASVRYLARMYGEEIDLSRIVQMV